MNRNPEPVAESIHVFREASVEAQATFLAAALERIIVGESSLENSSCGNPIDRLAPTQARPSLRRIFAHFSERHPIPLSDL